MILNFKTQINGVPTNFKEKILSGQKIHTIRKKGRWKPGDTIHFSTGARSKNYECFKVGTVVSVQTVVIDQSGKALRISIDGRQLTTCWKGEADKLIINDGINSLIMFHMFFKDGGEFDLIHWTDKRY